ncbi:MAG: DUF459 domain-containing protein [Candidatus Odyssella sp.]|nr:DUF459 domain-containing protein [Candidatus Odyssella sp.]
MRLALSFFALLAVLAAPFAGAQAETAKEGQPKTEEAKKETGAPRPFHIVVMGDSLSDGMWASLYRGYIRHQKEVRVGRYGVNSAGFTAFSFETEFEKIAAKGPIDLVIFMVGANDRQRAFAQGNGKEWAQFRTEKWHAIYRQNIQRFLGLLQQKKVPAVWIGLPIMRKDDASEDAKMMNGIYRELASAHGAIFVDIWKATANKDGEYDPFMDDDKGRKRRFRHDDGVHFTDFGYDHVIRFVLKAAKEKLPQLEALWSVPAP